MSTLDLGDVAPHRCPEPVVIGKGRKVRVSRPRCVVCDPVADTQSPVKAAALAAQRTAFADLVPQARTTTSTTPTPDPYGTADLFALEG